MKMGAWINANADGADNPTSPQASNVPGDSSSGKWSHLLSHSPTVLHWKDPPSAWSWWLLAESRNLKSFSSPSVVFIHVSLLTLLELKLDVCVYTALCTVCVHTHACTYSREQRLFYCIDEEAAAQRYSYLRVSKSALIEDTKPPFQFWCLSEISVLSG